eukprot:376930-Pyramimonas_sp.AAC.1
MRTSARGRVRGVHDRIRPHCALARHTRVARALSRHPGPSPTAVPKATAGKAAAGHSHSRT